MLKTLLLSLAPNALHEGGHDIVYQKCLETAARRLNLFYIGLFPRFSQVKLFQKNWRGYFPGNKFLKFIAYCRLFFIQREKIVFIESFNTLDFVFLTFACFLFASKRDRLLVLFRYEFSQLRYQKVRALCIHLCRKKLPSRFTMLTDSELIQREFQNYFNQPLQVMPIPHGEHIREERTSRDKLICWWPGLPKEAKGLSIMKKIASLPNRDPSKIEIVAAQQSLLPNTKLISDVLERQEYLFWLQEADFILLPYDPKIYRSSTSGIFVEAILAGKIPLVKKGSWLAFELLKFELSELIVDWDSSDFFLNMMKIFKNPQIQEKRAKMQDAYQRIHSQENFGEVFKRYL